MRLNPVTVAQCVENIECHFPPDLEENIYQLCSTDHTQT